MNSEQRLLISVIIPTYNRAEHLERAVQSALAEPGDFYEIVIGDDASPDHTPDVVARYRSHPRVRHFRNEVNLGLQANVLKTAKEARGHYIFILTDDDYLMPGALSKVKCGVEQHPSAGYLLSELPTVDERSGKIVHRHRTLPETAQLPPSLDTMVRIVPSAWVLSRQVYKRDHVDWNSWERFQGNIFFPIIVAGRLLLEAPFLYQAESLVMHTQFNQVFWHRFGQDDLDIQFNLDADAHRCMGAILFDRPPTPETTAAIEAWEMGCFKTYLYRAHLGFYDYVRGHGLRPGLKRLYDTYRPNRRQRLALLLFVLKVPILRAIVVIKRAAHLLPEPLFDRLRRLRDAMANRSM